MADLASSAVSLYPANDSSEFFPLGKDNRDIICRRLKLVLTSQGSTTNKITASALGFTKLLWCSNFALGGSINMGVVNPVLNIVELSLDGSDNSVDVSGTVYLTVIGTAKLSPAV